MCICTPCVCLVQGGQKVVLDFLDLESLLIEPPRGCWELSPGVCKSSQCSNHKAISITVA